MNETEHDLAVRIWSGNYAIDEVTTNEGKHFKLINLPFYMIAALPNILKKNRDISHVGPILLNSR